MHTILQKRTGLCAGAGEAFEGLVMKAQCVFSLLTSCLAVRKCKGCVNFIKEFAFVSTFGALLHVACL